MSTGPNWPLTIFVLLVVVLGVGWFASIVISAVRESNARVEAQERAWASPPAEWTPPPDADRDDLPVKAEQVALGDRTTVDLRGLPTVRIVIRGSGNWIGYSPGAAARYDSPQYALLREPSNRHDSNAIAVHHPNGRKVGYVSRTRAESMAPLLDRIGPAAFIVGGGLDDGRLRVALPSTPALRAFVKSGGYSA